MDQKNDALEAYLKQGDLDSQTAYEGTPSKKVLSTKQTTVAGLSAITRVEDLFAAGTKATQTYLRKDSNVYTFRLMAEANGQFDSENESIYNQMIATFKFTK